MTAFPVKLGANDLNCVDVPLNPTHSLQEALCCQSVVVVVFYWLYRVLSPIKDYLSILTLLLWAEQCHVTLLLRPSSAHDCSGSGMY